MPSESDLAGDLSRIGATFRDTRTSRNLSLDNAFRATRIRPEFLDAIERGDLRKYQSPVFAAGHIRIYARFLQVDPGRYLDALQPRSNEVTPDPTPVRRPSRRRRSRRFLAPALVTIVVIALSGYLFFQYATFVSGLETLPLTSVASPMMLATPIPTVTIATVATIPAVNAAPTAAPTSVATVAPRATQTPAPQATEAPTAAPVTPSGVHVEATMVGRVWVQVESDGQVIFSGILNTGDIRQWSASHQLMIWTGDAANVQVTYNGKSLGRLGSPGQVLKVTWTATS
jgi:cytoskeletal protein RodZ